MKEEHNKILARIISCFEDIAPSIVSDSVESLSAGEPNVDLYDSDFYMEKMKGVCDDIPEGILRLVLEENIEKVNDIFFKYYKIVKINRK